MTYSSQLQNLERDLRPFSSLIDTTDNHGLFVLAVVKLADGSTQTYFDCGGRRSSLLAGLSLCFVEAIQGGDEAVFYLFRDAVNEVEFSSPVVQDNDSMLQCNYEHGGVPSTMSKPTSPTRVTTFEESEQGFDQSLSDLQTSLESFSTIAQNNNEYALFAIGAKHSGNPKDEGRSYINVAGNSAVLFNGLFTELLEQVSNHHLQLFNIFRDVIRQVEANVNIPEIEAQCVVVDEATGATERVVH